MRYWLFASWAVSVLLVHAVPARATTVLPADFAEMVKGSQVIVHGRVTASRSYLTAARTIETLVTVAVQDPIKGPATAQVAFRLPTGQVGRYRRVMVGAPEFAEGDEVILFLRGRPPAVPMPFGLHQGVYRVTRAAGRATVSPVVTARAGRIVRGDPARRPMTVDAFAREVRAVMERP